MNVLKTITTPYELGNFIGNYLQEKGILLDINDCYSKLDDSSTNNYIAEINKLGLITECSDSYSYNSRKLKDYPNDVVNFYQSIFHPLREDLSDSIIRVTDIQNPYIVGYVPKSFNIKLIKLILKEEQYSDIILNTIHNKKPCTVRYKMIEYSNTPTVSRNITLITENNIYNYPCTSWGGWKLLDFGCNTITQNTVLSDKVKESIINNYLSIQFTTLKHQDFFEKIVMILKNIK